MSERDAAWQRLHTPNTTQEQLAQIAGEYPEFAEAIAAHPNVYPELRDWALGGVGVAGDTLPPPDEADAPGDVADPAARKAAIARWCWIGAALVWAVLWPILDRFWSAIQWEYSNAAFPVWSTLTRSSLVVSILLGAAAVWFASSSVSRKVWSGIILLIVLGGSLLLFFTTFSYGGRGGSFGLSIFLGPVLAIAWMIAERRQAWVLFSIPLGLVGGQYLSLVIYGAEFFSVLISIAGRLLFVAFVVLVGRPLRPRRPAPQLAAGYGSVVGYTPVPGQLQTLPDGTVVLVQQGSPRTNGLAITALVLGLIGGTILPIIFGHIALSQIRRSGENGRGMAIAGLILGYIGLAVAIALVIWVIAVSASLSRYSY